MEALTESPPCEISSKEKQHKASEIAIQQLPSIKAVKNVSRDINRALNANSFEEKVTGLEKLTNICERSGNIFKNADTRLKYEFKALSSSSVAQLCQLIKNKAVNPMLFKEICLAIEAICATLVARADWHAVPSALFSRLCSHNKIIGSAADSALKAILTHNYGNESNFAFLWPVNDYRNSPNRRSVNTNKKCFEYAFMVLESRETYSIKSQKGFMKLINYDYSTFALNQQAIELKSLLDRKIGRKFISKKESQENDNLEMLAERQSLKDITFSKVAARRNARRDRDQRAQNAWWSPATSSSVSH